MPTAAAKITVALGFSFLSPASLRRLVERGHTHGTIGEAVGYHHGTIAGWRNGARASSGEQLARLSRLERGATMSWHRVITVRTNQQIRRLVAAERLMDECAEPLFPVSEEMRAALASARSAVAWAREQFRADYADYLRQRRGARS